MTKNQPDVPTAELLERMDAYWRAANYLSVGQIYLYDNPLLKVPLSLEHVKPLVVGHWGTTPGSIHEGGELGYSLSHAFGAVFDNPDLIVACVVGDGEAETGPLATAWHSNKMLNPVSDGVVLPILHLNGYKISNPTLLARIDHDELEQFFRGCGWTPYYVEGDDPATMHEQMSATLADDCAALTQGLDRAEFIFPGTFTKQGDQRHDATFSIVVLAHDEPQVF